jgi:copper homeostasis protein CutC
MKNDRCTTQVQQLQNTPSSGGARILIQEGQKQKQKLIKNIKKNVNDKRNKQLSKF